MPCKEEALARQALQRAAEISGLPLQRRGFVPSPSQKEEIQTIVHDLGTNIQAVDVEISRLQELRMGMIEQCATSRSIMSPIRTLPRELLSEIFKIVRCELDTPHYRLSFPSHCLGCPPFASVCMEWRLTAFSTPALWTKFKVNSATRVHLQAVGSSARSAFSLPAQLSQHRWGSLTLYAYEALEPLDCPMLSVVNVIGPYRFREDKHDLMFLTNAPVRHLSLALNHLSATLPPWSALSSLKLTLMCADDTGFSLANRLINSYRQTLEILVVEDLDEETIDITHSNREEPVDLPVLVSIDLTSYGWAMMRTIIASNLREVTFRQCPTDDNLGRYMLTDSMQSVRCLTLELFALASLASLLEVLDGLPAVERIVVDDSEPWGDILYSDKFVSALANLGGNGRPVRLPNLASLALKFDLDARKVEDEERRQNWRTDCIVDGVLVKKLKELTTNLPDI
ncbi:hypothetical protein K525DRAFT_285724 [Schizophyllum commune Loenen D]|nr:hypothetical protein K525DRAFT_285724 [Schizophyllum commune Loenen D]